MSDTQNLLKQANWLFAQECVFTAGAATQVALPPPTLPEIAFAGRSNVGKSSLINALTGRRTLVKVSQTPGRTRQVNFFALANKLMLVDLPGYGYAEASKKQIAGWTKLINDYLKGRANLHRVCLLVDARHGLKPLDKKIMKLLDDAAVCYQLVLTKADKTQTAETEALIASIAADAANYPAMHPDVLLTSSREAEGIETLRMELAKFTQL